ncbi:uncharacterized protein LOC125054076 [Pieris napi]|uniref:uncharacterized protein LOC125054076 n=1 Tax=Pieris napi TaxID=78633 RepID=UPI001FBA5D2F|nr:uncharacterized protein LOC125054076 [Pieris napi]
MSNLCGSCGVEIRDGASCSVCKLDFHFQCGGITEVGYRRLGDRRFTWCCANCKISAQPQAVSTSASTSPLVKMPVESTILEEIRAVSLKLAPLESLVEDVKSLRKELSELKSSFSEINGVVGEFKTKIENFESRLSKVESDNQNIVEQYGTIQTRLDKLESEADDNEQWSRINNVEIKGVPQRDKENLHDIVNSIGQLINYTVQKNQINFVTRVPVRDSTQPKPIILCFLNRYAKEDFIAAARTKAKDLARSNSSTTCTNLGLNGNHKIFINDHLTPKNKDLLNKARKVAKDHNFQYIWVKRAVIHIRKDNTSPIIYIRNVKDISKII